MEMLRLLNKMVLFSILNLVLTDTLQAQDRICGNELKSNTESFHAKEKFENSNLYETFGYNRSPFTIPVVVHVVYSNSSENISDERIFSQLNILNESFNAENIDIKLVPAEFQNTISNIGINFCLASIDGQENPTNGIVRVETSVKEIGLSDDLFFTIKGGSDAWDTDKYLNIWVANTSDNISGFGTYPWITESYKTGLVIHPKYFGENDNLRYGLGKTTVHELGHFFGLNHTWGDTSDCGEDDGINDTPPQKKSYKGCPSYPQSGCSESEMFMNYMDYVDDKCMYFFTEGQKQMILSVLNTYRKGLTLNKITCKEFEIDEFKIYPNPILDYFTLEPDNIQEEDVTIFNLEGQKINFEFSKSQNKNEINFINFPKGLYFVKVKNLKPKLFSKI